MKTFLVLALLANSLDLVATTFGIHWFGNREGNPLMAPIAHDHWWAFVVVKGVCIPFLLWYLFQVREQHPRLIPAGFALVTTALAAAVGQWAGWIAGVITVSARFAH